MGIVRPADRDSIAATVLKALDVLHIPRKQIRVSYGFLAATFHRDTFFRLGKRSRYAKPAIAYLLKRYDELFGIANSTAD